VLLRLPPAGKTFNRSSLTLATPLRGGTNLVLAANLKGNSALVQSGLGTMRLEMSDDLVTWQSVNTPPALVARQARFSVPLVGAGSRFFRTVLEVPGQ